MVGLQVVDRYVNEVKGISPIPFLFHSISSFKKCHARSSSNVAQRANGRLTSHFISDTTFFVLQGRKARPKVRKIRLIINSLSFVSTSSDKSHLFHFVVSCRYLFLNSNTVYSIFYICQYTNLNESKNLQCRKFEIQRYNYTIVIAYFMSPHSEEDAHSKGERSEPDSHTL